MLQGAALQKLAGQIINTTQVPVSVVSVFLSFSAYVKHHPLNRAHKKDGTGTGYRTVALDLNLTLCCSVADPDDF
jgi:hypothetical protein